MIRSISTTENLCAPQDHFIPVMHRICIVAAIVAIASNGAISNILVATQHLAADSHAVLSTNIANWTDYTDRNNTLWWDGDSIMSSDKSNNLTRLFEIAQLPQNWNGNGASSFSQKLLSIAKNIVETSLIQASIFPTARDSIQFEYENDIGDYLEFEVFESGRIKAFSFSHEGAQMTKDVSFSDINEVVREFHGRDI